MRRKLFTLLSALSLLIFVAVCVLWVRSYWVADSVRLNEPRAGKWTVLAGSSRGAMLWSGIKAVTPSHISGGASPRWFTSPPIAYGTGGPRAGETGVRAHFSAGGFAFYWTDGGTAPPRAAPSPPGATFGPATIHPQWHALLPHWSAALLAAALPAAWLWSLRRRAKPGHCPRCGYDLRATPERCPECGDEAALVATPPTPADSH